MNDIDLLGKYAKNSPFAKSSLLLRALSEGKVNTASLQRNKKEKLPFGRFFEAARSGSFFEYICTAREKRDSSRHFVQTNRRNGQKSD